MSTTAKQLTEAQAGQLGMAFVDLALTPVPTEAVAAVGLDFCRAHRVLPVSMSPDGAVVALADPQNRAALDAIASATGVTVYPALAEGSELDAVLAGLAGAAAAPATAAVAAADQAAPAGPVPLAAEDAAFLAEIGFTDEAPEPEDGPGVIEIPQLLESAPESEESPDPLGLGLDLHINDLLEKVLEYGASDLHLTSGCPPQVRVNGDLHQLEEFGEMTPSELRRMIYAVLTQKQRERFETDLELDLSHPLPGKARFRVNVFQQRESLGCVMRTIPNTVVPLEQLGLPKVVREFAAYPRGLVLVTGPTGSGKSTTLASLIDIINQERPVHIMTVEDPIEFLHTHKKAIVNQREVGADTHGFAPALKHVLRQDPDVILVGEMRDLETIQTALTAAETGHLVYATLHTQDAPQSIDRVIDVFPPHQQQQVRVQLATSIQAIMTQQLIRTKDGRSRNVASEVMIATPAIRNLIREGKIYQIYSAMQAGGQFGMQTMDQSLAELVKAGRITYELALERCSNQQDLARLCGRM